jgi:hypothetical protein
LRTAFLLICVKHDKRAITIIFFRRYWVVRLRCSLFGFRSELVVPGMDRIVV